MPEPEKIVSMPVRMAGNSVPVSLDDVVGAVRRVLVLYSDPALGPESTDQLNEVPDELLQFWRSLVELAEQQQGAQTIGMLVTFAGIAIHRTSEEMKRDQFEILEEIGQTVRSQFPGE